MEWPVSEYDPYISKPTCFNPLKQTKFIAAGLQAHIHFPKLRRQGAEGY